MKVNYNEIDEFIKENREGILRDIARLVAVPSIEGTPAPGAPFGAEPKRALELGLEIAGELGLDTKNCENYIGYAELPAGSEKYISTVTHLDVVPVSDGWEADPFVMREQEGYLLGRGVMDDKGPSVLCLYALKYLKDKKIPLRYTVRALLGANEETHMHDVEYYLENYPAPAFCFSPDADFPVCNGEKGIFHGLIVSACAPENIIDIKGGFAPNAVPDKAEAFVKCPGVLPKPAERVAVEAKDGVLHITATGKGGHASLPEGLINAIGILVDYLLENNLCSKAEEEYFRVIKKLHDKADGSAIGIDADDGKFAPLTAVGGMIFIRDGHFVQSIDCRYPTNTSGKNISEIIEKGAAGAVSVEILNEMEPFYIEPDSPEIQTCINTYNEITGENAKLFTMGGGTYARHFPNAVSFGPEHPERPNPDFVGPVHGVNEGASIEYLLEALKIYIAALIKLQDVEF